MPPFVPLRVPRRPAGGFKGQDPLLPITPRASQRGLGTPSRNPTSAHRDPSPNFLHFGFLWAGGNSMTPVQDQACYRGFSSHSRQTRVMISIVSGRRRIGSSTISHLMSDP